MPRPLATLIRASLTALFIVLVLTPYAPAGASGPTMLNGKIVFQELTPLPDGTSAIQLFIINKDGSGLTQLTSGGVNSTPTWSPSGRSLAFVHSSSWTGRYELWVMDVKTGSSHFVAPDPCTLGPFERPAWSPDGSQLIFTRCASSLAVWKVNVDGTGLAVVWTPPTGQASSPSWSPDGSKIVFSYDALATDGIPNRIFTLNADGSGLTRLTTNTKAGAYSPQFSPDGSKIVYVQEGGLGTLGIMVMNADGTNPYAVSHFGRYAVVTPSWSPNGKLIVFASSEPACDGCASNSEDLFVTWADGSGGTRRLTLLPPMTFASFPTWRPRAAVT